MSICMFNVSAPINDVISIQMNSEMALLLADFIQDNKGNVESEIWAFKNALRKPGRGRFNPLDDDNYPNGNY